jgi:hypothetical protein
MQAFLQDLWVRRKSYLLATGLAAYALLDLSNGDLAHAAAKASAAATILGLKFWPDTPEAPR